MIHAHAEAGKSTKNVAEEIIDMDYDKRGINGDKKLIRQK